MRSHTAASSNHARKLPIKDPKGGLTAAGRRAFARKDGSHLRPGVRKSTREMSTTEMKRKGSWAVRFYGREGKLPPLVDAHGKPTRFALSAHAWGEPVPKTMTAARAIARKGRALLAKAKTKSTAKKTTAAKRKRAAKKRPGLVENINARKRAGTSRPKSRSTVSKKAYDAMEKGWKKPGAKKRKRA